MKVGKDVGIGTPKSSSRTLLERRTIEGESPVNELDMESPIERVASAG